MSSLGKIAGADRLDLLFDDNALLPLLFGEHDQNLARIEAALGVKFASRGNRVAISGPEDAADAARAVLLSLYGRLENHLDVGAAEVDAAVRLAARPEARAQAARSLAGEEGAIRVRKRIVTPRSVAQATYIAALREHELVFGLGPAGTGKTYLAVAIAVAMLIDGSVERIVLSRPALEAGERLGFLPGDMRDKIDPYLRPLYDALHDMLPGELVMKHLADGTIEVAPLAFMRGRTLANAYVILDEAQNTTPVQMKMFLTRLGENSRMAVTGDSSQVDLPLGARSGLRDSLEVLAGVEGVSVVRFTDADVVRHALVTKIVRAYDAKDRRLIDATARASKADGER